MFLALDHAQRPRAAEASCLTCPRGFFVNTLAHFVEHLDLVRSADVPCASQQRCNTPWCGFIDVYVKNDKRVSRTKQDKTVATRDPKESKTNNKSSKHHTHPSRTYNAPGTECVYTIGKEIFPPTRTSTWLRERGSRSCVVISRAKPNPKGETVRKVRIHTNEANVTSGTQDAKANGW